ncbi:hypothetical protein BJ508DRAFT_129828 [Ascobolus immersus RN42]|uniref:Uncharacterized protein n=1 Tax=Ascobolus immersus RN42 TaxID=1160509 RepID=A0A3N4I2Z2_ASCIM|nr:hypothetical protein BJ508DRAFT_129828 [Ascobolus immersus RN42]
MFSSPSRHHFFRPLQDHTHAPSFGSSSFITFTSTMAAQDATRISEYLKIYKDSCENEAHVAGKKHINGLKVASVEHQRYESENAVNNLRAFLLKRPKWVDRDRAGLESKDVFKIEDLGAEAGVDISVVAYHYARPGGENDCLFEVGGEYLLSYGRDNFRCYILGRVGEEHLVKDLLLRYSEENEDISAMGLRSLGLDKLKIRYSEYIV